jgi:transposase InsO family protein
MVVLTRREKALVRRAYFDPAHAGGFSSAGKLHKALHGRISLSKIKKFIQSQESYTVLRQAKRKFQRLKVVSPFINYMWDMDTASMSYYVKGDVEKKFFPEKNGGYKYFLVVIDVFSKFLRTAPLKTLNAGEMKTVLTDILSGTKPDHVRTDRGSEFKNRQVSALLRRLNIGHILTLNETKANYAERVIRTMKDKIGKYLEQKETHEWVNVLADITRNYNHTYHRTIKKAPVEVRKRDEITIWKMVYEKIPKVKRRLKRPPAEKSTPYKFEIGDYVRIVT